MEIESWNYAQSGENRVCTRSGGHETPLWRACLRSAPMAAVCGDAPGMGMHMGRRARGALGHALGNWGACCSLDAGVVGPMQCILGGTPRGFARYALRRGLLNVCSLVASFLMCAPRLRTPGFPSVGLRFASLSAHWGCVPLGVGGVCMLCMRALFGAAPWLP